MVKQWCTESKECLSLDLEGLNLEIRSDGPPGPRLEHAATFQRLFELLLFPLEVSPSSQGYSGLAEWMSIEGKGES